jgi:hypothetical protein
VECDNSYGHDCNLHRHECERWHEHLQSQLDAKCTKASLPNQQAMPDVFIIIAKCLPSSNWSAEQLLHVDEVKERIRKNYLHG